MKRIFWIALTLSTAWLCGYSQNGDNQDNSDDVYYESDNNNAPAAAPDNSADQNAPAPTYQQFYDQLSPYGQWIDYPGYGYCWVPNQLPPDFSPYMTNGYWAYTDMGETWVSDYPWGWACFHYGRWFEDATYGWMWVPGYDWAPAWVVWGDYGDYYCWAPIGPGVIVSPHYRPDYRWWHFVDHGHINDPHFDRYAVHGDVVARGGNFKVEDFNNHINVMSHANTYKQSVFFTGPKAEAIEKYSGHPVQHYTLNNVKSASVTHVAGNQLNIYRPGIQRTEKQPAPANVKPVQENHPASNEHQNAPQQRNEAPQQRTQQWTPPRSEPQQPVRQQEPAQRAPERNFIPSSRPAPQPEQHYSAPQRSAPAPQRSFSPAPSRGGGGGRR